MNYKIEVTEDFLKDLKPLAKKYRSIKNDLVVLQTELLENPFTGDRIAENFYKVRMAIKSKGRGKSGGARVISSVEVTYVDNGGLTNIVLLAIYDKSKTATASINALRAIFDNHKRRLEEE